MTSEQKKIFKAKELEEYFEEKQKQLNEAYEILSNERKRAQYDVLGKVVTSLAVVDESESISFEELKERYKDYKKENRKAQRDSKTMASTSANLGVDLSGTFITEDLPEEFIEQDGKVYQVVVPKVSFTNSAFSQSFHTPISKLDTIIFHGNANCDQLSSENVSHTVALQWRHTMDPSKESTQLDIATIYSSQSPNNLTVITSGTTKLSDFSYGSMKWIGQMNGVSPTLSTWLAIAGFQLVYKRQLFSDNSLFGSLSVSFPQDSNISFTLDKSFVHDGSTLSTDFRIAPSDTQLSCEFRRNLPQWLKTNFFKKSTADDDDEDIELATDVALTTADFIEYDLGFNVMLVKPIGDDTELGFGFGGGLEEGVNLKLSLKRNRHNFNLPITLSHMFSWKLLLLSAITPIACFSLLKSFVFDPISSYWKKKDIKQKRKEAYLQTHEKRQKALQELEKIKEQALQSRNSEEEVNGLVIINAKYGDLEGDDTDEGEYPSWIDITDQLQFLVTNSKLSLPEYSKSKMEGCFDPAPGTPKTLLVWYRFRGKTHRVEVDDEAELKIPLEEDLIMSKTGGETKVSNNDDDDYEDDESDE